MSEMHIRLPESDIDPGMQRKYVDKAIYFTMVDAANGNTDFRLVGRNVFRPGVERPKPDEFLADTDVVMSILRDLKQRTA